MGRKRDMQIADLVGKPISEKMDRLEEAVQRDGEQTREEYKNQIGEVIKVVDVMRDDLSSREKKDIYDLNTIIDISTLEETEKRFLVEALYTLAGTTEQITEAQQSFIRSVQKYLGIKNIQTMINLASIENINNIPTQKALLQTIMEFLFLENNDHSYMSGYEDVLSHFSVNKNGVQKIQNAINNIYSAVGEQGLVEKYGYVSIDTVYESCELADTAGIPEEDYTAGKSNIDSENDINDAMEIKNETDVIVDDTIQSYPEIRNIVLENVRNLLSYRVCSEKIERFIHENKLGVEVDTVISLVDCNFLGSSDTGRKVSKYVSGLDDCNFLKSNDTGILFTTAGIYYKNFFHDLIKFYYKDIDTISIDYKYINKSILILIIKLYNGNTIKIKDSASDAKVLFNMLNKIKELADRKFVAQLDQPIPLTKMNIITKMNYSKIIINLMTIEVKKYDEIYNYICTLNIDGPHRRELIEYIEKPNEDTNKLLYELDKNVEYGSKKSVRYSLIQDMAFILYMNHKTIINSREQIFIDNVANKYNIPRKVIHDLIYFAQIPARIIDGSITEKEASELAKNMTLTLSEIGVPFATAVGSEVLFGVLLGFDFIPGIGVILGYTILNASKKINFNKRRSEAINKVSESYRKSVSNIKIDKDIMVDNTKSDSIIDSICDEIFNLLLKKLDGLEQYR